MRRARGYIALARSSPRAQKPTVPRLQTALACLASAALLVPAYVRAERAAAAPAQGATTGDLSDPVLEALWEREQRHETSGLRPGHAARLTLELLDLVPGSGTRPVGRFSAPCDIARRVLLERRVELPARSALEAASVEVRIEVRPRLVTGARARFEIESRVRPQHGGGAGLARALAQELAAGSSSLFEVFQVPGTSRRLLAALSWHTYALDSLQQAGGAPQPAVPGRMIDLVINLIRTEKGAEVILRRETLSTSLGTQARSLLRLDEDPLSPGAEQRLDVHLTPRSLDAAGLFLGIDVRGALEVVEDGPAVWIEHQDDTRIGSGRRYSLPLSGGDSAASGYRLDIIPRF